MDNRPERPLYHGESTPTLTVPFSNYDRRENHKTCLKLKTKFILTLVSLLTAITGAKIIENNANQDILDLLNNRKPITREMEQEGWKRHPLVEIVPIEGMKPSQPINVRSEPNFFDGRLVGQVDQGTQIKNVIEIPRVKGPGANPTNALAAKCQDFNKPIYKDGKVVKFINPNDICYIDYHYGKKVDPNIPRDPRQMNIPR